MPTLRRPIGAVAAGVAALGLTASCSPKAPSTRTTPTAALPVASERSPVASSQPAQPSPQASLASATKDFSQAGSNGTPYHMTYAATADGRTTTRFQITASGELITHVGGPAGLMRNDKQVTPNYWAFTYDIPLDQVDDIGGVLYVGGGEFACSIAPGP